MFTDNLKNLRLSYHLTQKELAENLGTSQQTYMKWETGKISPTLKTINKIAKFFDVPITQLVFDNMIQIEDILNSKFIDYKGIQLDDEEYEHFQFYIQDFIKNELEHFQYEKHTKGIRLKSGKFVFRSNDD